MTEPRKKLNCTTVAMKNVANPIVNAGPSETTCIETRRPQL
jgi:hypothetical protein